MELSVIEKHQVKVKTHRKYSVIFWDDNITRETFVMSLLIDIFNKDMQEALSIVYSINTKGSSVVGVYSKDIAFTKINEVEERKKIEKYPLKVTMEEII